MWDEILEIFDMFNLYLKKNEETLIRINNCEYILAQTKVTIQKHRFSTKYQFENKHFQSFPTDLRKLATNSKYGQIPDSPIVLQVDVF